MANSLFFCTTPTICGMGHNLFVQAGTKTSDTCAEAVKTEPRCSFRAIPGRWVSMSVMKARSLVVFSNHYLLHWWSAQSAPLLLFSSVELMSCAAGTIGCLALRCRAFPPCELMRAGWSRFPGPMARRAGESAALLRRNPARWMPAVIGRLSAGVGRRHPVKLFGHLIPNLLGLFSNTPGNRRKTQKFLSWTVARLLFEITFIHFNANCTIIQEKSTGCGTDSESGKCCYEFCI